MDNMTTAAAILAARAISETIDPPARWAISLFNDLAPHAAFTATAIGGFSTWVSDAARGVTGIDPSELVGHGYMQLLDHHDNAAYLAERVLAWESGRPVFSPIWIRARDHYLCGHIANVATRGTRRLIAVFL